MVVIAKTSGAGAFQLTDRVGVVRPAHATALGKVLLAARPWPEVRQLIERYGWRPYTRKSIQDFARLRGELTATKERGYAVDNEERNRGTVCLGWPIVDCSGGVVAALRVSGKVDKLTPEFREQALPRVLEAADRISFRLGYHSSSAFL